MAAGHPALSAELLSVVEADDAPTPGPAVLEFIGRVRPRSGLLRRYCFAALAITNAFHDGPDRAGELLGEHFRGDAAVLDDLMSRPTMNSTGKVMALCTGWGESQELHAVFEEVREGRLAPRVAAQYALGFSVWEADRIPSWLCRFLDGDSPRIPVISGTITNALVRRMRSDARVNQAILGAYMRRVELSSLQCSAPRLLGTLGMGPLGHEVLSRRLADELDKANPDFGFDLESGEVQSVVVSLLGTLAGRSA